MAERLSSKMLRDWIQGEYALRLQKEKEKARIARELRQSMGVAITGRAKKQKTEAKARTRRISGKREKVRKSVARTPGAVGTLTREETFKYDQMNEKTLDSLLKLGEKRRELQVKRQEKQDDRRWKSAEAQAKDLLKYEEIKPSEVFSATEAIHRGELGARPEPPERPEGVIPFGAPSPESQQLEQDIFRYGSELQSWKDIASGRKRPSIAEKYPSRYGEAQASPSQDDMIIQRIQQLQDQGVSAERIAKDLRGIGIDPGQYGFGPDVGITQFRRR